MQQSKTKAAVGGGARGGEPPHSIALRSESVVALVRALARQAAREAFAAAAMQAVIAERRGDA
jgi:hypothetical protein